jgi:hypothetical protein
MTPYVKNIRLYEEHTLAAWTRARHQHRNGEWQSDGYHPKIVIPNLRAEMFRHSLGGLQTKGVPRS